jgi:hypothetical protein
MGAKLLPNHVGHTHLLTFDFGGKPLRQLLRYCIVFRFGSARPSHCQLYIAWNLWSCLQQPMVGVDSWGTGGEREPDVPHGYRQLKSPRYVKDGCHRTFLKRVMGCFVIGSGPEVPAKNSLSLFEIRCVPVFLFFITQEPNQIIAIW